MRILGLMLIAILARVRGLTAVYGHELWDPFTNDPVELMDPVRNKRNPLSIYLTYEKEGYGQNSDALDSSKITDMGYNQEGKKIVKKLIYDDDCQGNASEKPATITIVRNCKCKSKQNQQLPSNQETHEDPFKRLHLSQNYPTPSLGGRISADESEEELLRSKNIWAMTSEELMSGTYSQPSLIPDGKHRSSPMATVASKQFTQFSSYPFTTRNPAHELPKIPQQLPQFPQSLHDQGYSPVSFLTGESNPQDEIEHEIIQRITSEYDLGRGISDFDQQLRVREAVMDFIKSKYPVKESKKHILAETKLTNY